MAKADIKKGEKMTDIEKEISSLLVVNPTEGTNASAVQEEVKKKVESQNNGQ